MCFDADIFESTREQNNKQTKVNPHEIQPSIPQEPRVFLSADNSENYFQAAREEKEVESHMIFLA
jgi:hypothetical protein